MLKNAIERAALSGRYSSITGRDVARVSRNRRSITLRHVWLPATDGRIWDVVVRAARALAAELAASTKRDVEIYHPNGACAGVEVFEGSEVES